MAQLNPRIVCDEATMTTGLRGLTETAKVKHESDNITAILIHTKKRA